MVALSRINFDDEDWTLPELALQTACPASTIEFTDLTA